VRKKNVGLENTASKCKGGNTWWKMRDKEKYGTPEVS